MNVTVNQLQAEIREIEGVDVVVHSAKLGDLFPSYKQAWPKRLADERTLSAFKRRLEVCLRGYSYGILKADGNKTQGAGNIYMGTVRGVVVDKVEA